MSDAQLYTDAEVAAAVANAVAAEEALLANEQAQVGADAFEQGRKDELARCREILLGPEAKGRFDTAMALALETDMPADAAVKVLSKLPMAPEVRKSGFKPFIVGLQPDHEEREPRNDFERGRRDFAALPKRDN